MRMSLRALTGGSVLLLAVTVMGGGAMAKQPEGHGKPVRMVVVCKEAKNHGDYVSSQAKHHRAEAAKKNCGMPNPTRASRKAAKSACKLHWRELSTAANTFKNRGACVSYYAKLYRHRANR